MTEILDNQKNFVYDRHFYMFDHKTTEEFPVDENNMSHLLLHSFIPFISGHQHDEHGSGAGGQNDFSILLSSK